MNSILKLEFVIDIVSLYKCKPSDGLDIHKAMKLPSVTLQFMKMIQSVWIVYNVMECIANISQTVPNSTKLLTVNPSRCNAPQELDSICLSALVIGQEVSNVLLASSPESWSLRILRK